MALGTDHAVNTEQPESSIILHSLSHRLFAQCVRDICEGLPRLLVPRDYQPGRE